MKHWRWSNLRMIKQSILVLLLCVGCHRVPDSIEPKVNTAIQEQSFRSLPSPFRSLSPIEANTPWGIEYRIGVGFARKLDLYQAITSFKRAAILIPPEETERSLEIDYNILLSYYLGKKYPDTLATFDD